MAITTYITSTEANYLYNNDASFTANQRTNALTVSFGLVNDYLNSALAVPVMTEWDGTSTIEAPSVLKVAQGRFYQWILETGNIGHTDELQALFDSVKEMVQGITANEIAVSTAMVFEAEAGWHITSITRGTGFETTGGVYVRGTPPTYRSFYRITTAGIGEGEAHDTGGYVADEDFTWTAYRSDDDAARVSTQVPTWEWQSVDSAFEIRWDGQWGDGCTIYITGIPESDVNKKTPQKNDIKQALLRY